MFSTEEQERQYRNITADGPLHTRLMFFDLMQIVEPIAPPVEKRIKEGKVRPWAE